MLWRIHIAPILDCLHVQHIRQSHISRLVHRHTLDFSSNYPRYCIDDVFNMAMTKAIGLGVALSIAVVASCSDSGNKATQSTGQDTRPTVDLLSLYDPSSLREVRNFADLPEGVQSLANASYMKIMSDNQYPHFLVGGVGESSAIVAFEVFGYVPVFDAAEYVHSASGWVYVKRWNVSGNHAAFFSPAQ